MFRWFKRADPPPRPGYTLIATIPPHGDPVVAPGYVVTQTVDDFGRGTYAVFKEDTPYADL